jgi:hypothetical protein
LQQVSAQRRPPGGGLELLLIRLNDCSENKGFVFSMESLYMMHEKPLHGVWKAFTWCMESLYMVYGKAFHGACTNFDFSV